MRSKGTCLAMISMLPDHEGKSGRCVQLEMREGQRRRTRLPAGSKRDPKMLQVHQMAIKQVRDRSKTGGGDIRGERSKKVCCCY